MRHICLIQDYCFQWLAFQWAKIKWKRGQLVWISFSFPRRTLCGNTKDNEMAIEQIIGSTSFLVLSTHCPPISFRFLYLLYKLRSVIRNCLTCAYTLERQRVCWWNNNSVPVFVVMHIRYDFGDVYLREKAATHTVPQNIAVYNYIGVITATKQWLFFHQKKEIFVVINDWKRVQFH